MASGLDKKKTAKKKPSKKAAKKKIPKKKEPINKGGRPSPYKTEFDEQARKLCLLGYTDQQLADFFEVNVSSINRWKQSKKGFRQALKAGKDIADCEVVDSLYNRATGNIKITEQKLDKHGDIHDCERELAPCPTSIIFWLKNRQSDKWRDKPTDKGSDVDLAEALNNLADSLPS